jgi:hypothetical protein
MIGYGNSMFLATHGILARSASGGGVDPDAQAFITAAAITDPTQQSAINTLVVDLKGYSIWTKMKALYPFVGGTASTHKFNLKDPRDLDAAFRLVFYGGGTHSANGYQPNGVNGSADTFLNPSTTLGLNNSGMSFYSRENKVTNCLMGSGGGGGVSILMIPDFGNNFDYSSVDGDGFRTPVQADKRGLFTVSRIASANEQGYRNGVQYYNNNFTSIARPNASILIGARNLSGQYSNVQCAFSAIHDGLTDTEAANLYTAVQNFNTALARQV